MQTINLVGNQHTNLTNMKHDLMKGTFGEIVDSEILGMPTAFHWDHNMRKFVKIKAI